MTDYGRSILEAAVSDHPESVPARVMLENFHHFVALNNGFHRGCGSYLFDGQTYRYQRETLKKQEHLFYVGQQANRVLEIGVYVGHSLLILLLSNPTLRITCIDNDSSFSPQAVEYLNKHFNDRIVFYYGSAEDVLRNESLGTFDCIHIDADHNEVAVAGQFNLSLKFAQPNAMYVFDDYEALRPLIDTWMSDGTLSHVFTPWCLWTNVITRLNNKSL
jgi:hypothetical protein